MAERDTAELQLQRLLYTFAAAQGEGIAIGELAARLDTTREQILRDLEEVTARDFYLPPGPAEAIQVVIEADRVSVFTGKDRFLRPVRLGPREAAALGLALRSLALECSEAERGRLLELAGRLEADLGTVPIEGLERTLGVAAGAGSDEGIRRILMHAAGERLAVSIRYLKEGHLAPEAREVEPYLLGYADGFWYMVARCCRAEAVRVFRLDRVLEVRTMERTFQPSSDFDPVALLCDGRIFFADTEVVARVRYTSTVARWVREHEEVEDAEDGAVIVRHRVANPEWLIRHVLRFGGHAAVVDPPELREMVGDAAARILGAAPSDAIQETA